ncbi:MAG: 3-phenylpropionate/trans-cinnamate dioxygenase ferredoxin reductase subunit HcaD [Oceanicaulis sp. HLUCCA04]|nr:MAG: 3-phenylpropionate/trans-cinnamate dioxygenase ferredoxin reductase subunit HcaD [Oceanicaulis sp. HLUCCA04]
MSTKAGTVIIGAGQAGLSCAAELRRRKYEGPVTLIGAEPALPYQRPPLSKAYLAGELPVERLWLKPEAFYPASDITCLTNARVTAIDREARQVVLADGARLAFENCVIATGGEARIPPIPGANLPGVDVLRTFAEADHLSAALEGAKSLAVIGAGYIGLEVAASARKRGLEVVVLEAAERPMARTASPILGGWFGAVHRGYGVDLRVSTPVAAILDKGGKAAGVRLADGEEIPTDTILLAAGLALNTGLAEAAGLECADGIIVDMACRTSDGDIYACGDVARFSSALYGRSVRLESVQNAIEQGKAVAAAILGEDVAYDPVPWFWSDQYELKLQIAGLIDGADMAVRRGDPEMGNFAVFHLKDSRIIACEAVNAAPEYMAAQKLIRSGKTVDPDALRNLDVAMRELLA